MVPREDRTSKVAEVFPSLKAFAPDVATCNLGHGALLRGGLFLLCKFDAAGSIRGHAAFVGSNDMYGGFGYIEVMDRERKTIFKKKDLPGAITAVSFSPDGDHLIYCMSRGPQFFPAEPKIHRIELARGTETIAVDGSASWWRHLDNDRALSLKWRARGAELYLWDAKNLERIEQVQIEPFSKIALSPDRKLIAVSRNEVVRVYELRRK